MKIVLTGSVAFDYLMKFPGYFKEHILPDHLDSISLSFLVDSMTRMRGGIAPNIAYTLALLGNKPFLWATVGEDFSPYRSWLERVGVETSGAKVISGEYTASFFVNTDLANNQIASFYPGAMAHAAKHSLAQLIDEAPDLVVISPNSPDAMVKYVDECRKYRFPYIFDPSQQIVRLEADELRSGVESAIALFVNDYEFALIEKVTGWNKEVMFEKNPDIFIVVTSGEKGADIYVNNGHIQVPVVPPEQIVDPTGVGDAFRGGFLTGYSLGLDLEFCGKLGTLAATYCLEQEGPQGHSFTLEEFVERFESAFGYHHELERILNNARE